MENNKNYIMLFVVNIIKTFSSMFFVLCVVGGILAISAGDVYWISIILITIFADIAVYCIMDFWMKWIVLEKCDVQAQEKIGLILLKRMGYKDNVHLHKTLLISSLILGRYDESRQEIDELHRLNRRLKPTKKLDVQFYILDYLIAVNDTASFNVALEEAQNALTELNIKNERMKQRFQINLTLRQYLIEERWEDLRVILKEARKELQKKDMAALANVMIAFYHGQCCYHLGRFEEAFHELKYAAKYGGNTKYVALANELIENILEKNPFFTENKTAERSIKGKHRIDKTVIIIAVNCLLLVLSIGFNRYCAHGSSIEDAYSRRYICAQDELAVIYRREIDNYEMVILYDKGSADNVAYCLFEETDSGCKIVNSYRFHMDFDDGRYGTERDKWFYQETEISMVFFGFYKENDVFYQEDMVYTGICSLPIADNIVADGNPVSAEDVIYIEETPVYLWSVENVNLRTSIEMGHVVE